MNTSTDSVDPTPWVTVQRKGSVAWLTLNRPAQYNALSEQMLARLHAALDAVAADSAVRVVVLGGAGKAFCAGHDLKQMKANPAGVLPAAVRRLQPLDDADPISAAAGDRARARHRHGRGLSAGGDVRSCDRGR